MNNVLKVSIKICFFFMENCTSSNTNLLLCQTRSEDEILCARRRSTILPQKTLKPSNPKTIMCLNKSRILSVSFYDLQPRWHAVQLLSENDTCNSSTGGKNSSILIVKATAVTFYSMCWTISGPHVLMYYNVCKEIFNNLFLHIYMTAVTLLT